MKRKISAAAMRGPRGYTLLELLIVAAIITILVGAGTVAYLEVQRRTTEKAAAERLQQLVLYEKLYIRSYGEYAEFWQLQEQGYIDPQYTEEDNPAHTHGIPFVPDYVLVFDIPGDGTYRIEATSVMEDTSEFHPRWLLLGGIWDLRAMYVDDRGVVRWMENDRPVF